MCKNPDRQLVRKKESTRGDYEAEKRVLFTIRPGNSILIHLFTVVFSIYFIAALCISAELLFHRGNTFSSRKRELQSTANSQAVKCEHVLIQRN